MTHSFRRDEIALTILKHQAMRGFCAAALKFL
jgi:hypothetical protein